LPQLSEQRQKLSKPASSEALLQGLRDEVLGVLRGLENQNVPTEKELETVLKVTAYRGAWPPASVIKEQEAAHPGAGERLLLSTERQTAHRHAMEKMRVEGQERRMDRGQMFSLAVPICSFFCAAYIAATVNSLYGTIIAVSALVIGVGGPAALHVAKGIGEWLGNKDNKGS
jgi:uncharacterized membrane protein